MYRLGRHKIHRSDNMKGIGALLCLFFVHVSALRLRLVERNALNLCIGICGFLHPGNAEAAIDLKPMNDKRYDEIVRSAIKDDTTSEATMETVPSRKVKVTMADGMKSNGPIDDFLLQNIPSYKYFKIINKEYSSRSTAYVEGEENPFAAFQ